MVFAKEGKFRGTPALAGIYSVTEPDKGTTDSKYF